MNIIFDQIFSVIRGFSQYLNDHAMLRFHEMNNLAQQNQNEMMAQNMVNQQMMDQLMQMHEQAHQQMIHMDHFGPNHF